MDKTYSVGQFARLAGVTVRTLHFYDEAGLLQPTRHPANERRQYQEQDLLRLQQILTLKYLGFSLQEIEALIKSPAYNVRASLHMQKQAIDHRILQMQQVSYALSRVMDMLADQASPVDWGQVIAVIQGLTEASRADWLREYFPAEVWDWMHQRAVQMPPDMIQQGAQAWREVYTGFQAVRHLPVDAPAVQACAAQMHQLISLFTQDNPHIEQGLQSFYERPNPLPEAYGEFHNPELQAFMQAALQVYREKMGKG